MLNGVAKLLSPFFQSLILLSQERHRVPLLRNIVGGEQDTGPAAHGNFVGGNTPYRGIRKAKYLLSS